MTKSGYFERKEKITIMNYESAFKCYDGLINKISSIRQWTLTIMIALIVIILTNPISLFSIIIPAIVTFITFLLLELRARFSMRFNKNEILYLEGIFLIENEDDYKKNIENYIFRDTRLLEMSKTNRIKKVPQIAPLLNTLNKTEFFIWYGAWTLIWTLIIVNNEGGYFIFY